MAWENLDEDIAAEFALFAGREDEIDDAYERRSSDRRQRAREGRRLEHGLVQRKKRARIALRLAAGCCAWCDEKRAPRSRRLCAAHLRRNYERDSPLKRQRGRQELAAGRCYNGCGRPIRKQTGGNASHKAKRPVLCEPCVAELRRRHDRKVADLAAAGMCASACGRPVRQRPARNGRMPRQCETCAALNTRAVQRAQKNKLAMGLCPCGQPIRKLGAPPRKRSPPVLCEVCAAKRRARHVRKPGQMPRDSLLVPAAPVRAHLLQLRSLGIAWRAMASVAGVSRASVQRVLDVTTLRVYARVAERILELEAVRCDESIVAAAA